MAGIRVDSLTKRFRSVTALDGVSFEVKDGEFFVLLGPPGAGKTTTLRTIIGLESPDAGEVYMDDTPLQGIYPGRRDMAIIFQNLALYPDKTVFDNIAFPLRRQKVPQMEVRARVEDVADVLRIEPLLGRLPAYLSGGERQRVAIGRALVRRPRVFLLDEPLSNLDALLRLEMRSELKRLQLDLGQTVIYATHDQVEAMTMGDRVLVLNEGKVQQIDTPEGVYRRPRNTFVAGLLGSPPMNLLRASYDGGAGSILTCGPLHVDVTPYRASIEPRLDGKEVILGIRPEDVRVSREPTVECQAETRVHVFEPLGSEIIIDLRMADQVFRVVVPQSFRVDYEEAVWVHFPAEKIHLFDPASQQVLHNAAA